MYYLKVIYQRQTQKNNLASFSHASPSSKGRQSKSSTRFTPEELRDCFTLKEGCACDTKNKIGGGIWKDYSKSISFLSLFFLSIKELTKVMTQTKKHRSVHYCFFSNRWRKIFT